MRFFKPMRGCRIYTSAKHMTRPAGELVGICIKVDDNQCVFEWSGEVDLFIWRFRDGLNDWFEYAA